MPETPISEAPSDAEAESETETKIDEKDVAKAQLDLQKLRDEEAALDLEIQKATEKLSCVLEE